MNILAAILAVMSLLALSVPPAGAGVSRPPCAPQVRAEAGCVAPGLPGQTVETARKPGVCLSGVIPAASPGDVVRGCSRLDMASGATMPARTLRTVPWRPPRG